MLRYLNALWGILSGAILILLTLPDPPPDALSKAIISRVSIAALVGIVGVVLGVIALTQVNRAQAK